MKLARFAHPDRGRFWGEVDTEKASVTPIEGAFADWATVAASDGASLRRAQDRYPLASLTRLAPVEPGARIFGVGANYRVHLEKLGAEPPAEPVAYIKPDSAIVAPEAEIQYPRTTRELDFEIELVAVLARALDPEEPNPAKALLGYTVGNDVSARDAMSPFGGPDLYSMKALDASSPVGPWVSTLDEVGGSGQPGLEIELRVDGEVRQHDNTATMIHSIDQILRYLDARTKLRPGDLVFTGTTCGVGKEDGRYLEPGNVIEAEIESIGVLRNTVGPRTGGRSRD